MKVLISGANGYIGTRLLHVLAESGHEIVALVRSKERLWIPDRFRAHVHILEVDFLEESSLADLPHDIDAAYYLVHSMTHTHKGFADLELKCAQNFCASIALTQAQQIIYLSGLAEEAGVSEHMDSRRQVEDILKASNVPVTTLRASIIIGSGSASFEIIRDLVEKLPVMVAPKWVSSKSQPIAIRDVLYFLEKALLNHKCIGQDFEMGGPDILTYKQMLLEFARVRKLKRYILSIPFLTPYLSSLWLFFITSTNFCLARALVNSLKTDSVCTKNHICRVIDRDCLSYSEAVEKAFEKIEQHSVISSWKDAMSVGHLKPHLSDYIQVPDKGCFKNHCEATAEVDRDRVIHKLWRIGGRNGWYYMDWAWAIRGWMDRMVGGVGLRRGRTHYEQLNSGDVLDFWRVLFAGEAEGRLLLYAEMKLPGDAWLEWKVVQEEGKVRVKQTATFRPRGLFGRIYWYVLCPIHFFLFQGLCNSLLKVK